MSWYQWFTLGSLLACVTGVLFHLVRLIRHGTPRDFSRSAGPAGPAIVYAFSGAMDPRRKESASLHRPTYAAGLAYHAGTFVAFVLFAPMFIFDARPTGFWMWLSAGVLLLSSLSGLGILVKRFALRKLRCLSTPDDYISNILLTGFHLLTLWLVAGGSTAPFYYLWTGILLLYIPLGKLKHALYFVAARVQAGFFYGRRGVWPAARR